MSIQREIADRQEIQRRLDLWDVVIAALKDARWYVALRVESVPENEQLVEDVAALLYIDSLLAQAERQES